MFLLQRKRVLFGFFCFVPLTYSIVAGKIQPLATHDIIIVV